MSQSLENLINKVMQDDTEALSTIEKLNFEREEYISSVKERVRNRIYEEIENEIYDKIVEKAEKELEMQSLNRQIDEFKKATIIGVLFAFFIGLLVNQFTDIINFYKNVLKYEGVFPTVCIIVVLLGICGFIIWHFIFSTMINLLKELKRK